MRATPPISWLTPARKAFDDFPEGARETMIDALSVPAEGGKAGIAKPMKGMGSGVFEIALSFRSDAFRWYMRCNSVTTFGSCTHFRRNRPRGSRHPSEKLT